LPQSICCSCLKILEDVNSLKYLAQQNENVFYGSDSESPSSQHFNVAKQVSNLSRQASIFQQQRQIAPSTSQQQRPPFYNYVPYQHTPMQSQPQEIQQYFGPYTAQFPPNQYTRLSSYRQQFQHQDSRFNGLKWKQPHEEEGTSTEEDFTSNEEGISPLRESCPNAISLDHLQYRSFRLTVNAATDASTEYNFNAGSFNENDEAPEQNCAKILEPEPELETPDNEVAFMINFEQPKWK
jgi:hypothetical protein